MNNHYIKEEIPKSISDIVYDVLSENSISDIFDYNLWIAGGFPRIIQKIMLNNLNPGKEIYHYFENIVGDIDIFSSSHEDIEKFILSKQQDYKVYSSPFALNFSANFYKYTNVQIVHKFLYESFESCLESFDFTNCKYLIYKENGKLCLLKNSRADMFSKANVINIDKCVSPLLAQRIVKYYNKHNFKSLSDSLETKKSMKEYLFKIASNCWDEKFKCMGDLDCIANFYIKNLHSKINLTSNQLSILVGKFNESRYSKVRSGYGFYLEYSGQVDWASNEIRKNSL